MPWQYRCPRCGKTSHSEQDAKLGYCGACHDFTRIKFNILTCIARDCERAVPDRMVMCDAHWKSIPREVQQDFYRARYKHEQGFEGGEILVSVAMKNMKGALGEQ